jgi:hypothetical protein
MRAFASQPKNSGARHAAALALLVVFSLLFVSRSFAFVVTAQQRAACAPDVYRLCSSEIPNVSKIIDCMRHEKANLSPGCRAVVDAAEEQYAKRSVLPPESVWCQFGAASQSPADADWLKWCGPAAAHYKSTP